VTEPADGLDAPVTIDLDLLTAGDDEDMEAYTGLDDCVARVYAAVREQGAEIERWDAGETKDPPGYFIEHVRPAKLRAALLGVMKRHADPSFGPERWRELPYAALLRTSSSPAEGEGGAEGGAAGPTEAAGEAASGPAPSGGPPGSPSSRPGDGAPTSAGGGSPPTPQ
jgi:hypothetical protein